MRRCAIVIATVVASIAGVSRAEAQEEDQILARARNAFEYRDFAKVLEVLDPWVHPPRIADPRKMAEAQRLLGVSLHVLGDIERARREFEQVLQFDPELKLDPFAVPPQVIETFEAVRAEMRPVLDKILAARRGGGKEPEESALPPSVPHPLFAYAPLAMAHFLVLDAPEWGALWLGLQLLGLATNVTGYWLAAGLQVEKDRIAREDVGAHDRYVALQIGGLAVLASAWIASGIQAHVLLAEHRAAQREAQSGTVAIGFTPHPAPSAPVGLVFRFH